MMSLIRQLTARRDLGHVLGGKAGFPVGRCAGIDRLNR